MRKIGQMSGDDSQGITLMQYVRVYKLLLVYRSFCTPTRSLFQFAPDKCNNGPKFSVRFSVIITSVDYYVDCWSNTTMRRNLILLHELWMRVCIQIDLKFIRFSVQRCTLIPSKQWSMLYWVLSWQTDSLRLPSKEFEFTQLLLLAAVKSQFLCAGQIWTLILWYIVRI